MIFFFAIQPTTALVRDSGHVRLGSSDSLPKILLQTVEVMEKKGSHGVPEFSTDRLHQQQAFEHSGTPLARQLEGLPGLTVLSSGGQLTKPVINGMHSQRILILQDGVRLEGQAWGSDHAPEIDPFQEGEWTLLQAAASLRHGPEALGGVLDQQAIPMLQHGHWDVHASSVLMHNNGLLGMHLRLQGPLDQNNRWRIRWQGSSRINGNYRIPGSYLANTGNREQGSTLELQFNHGKWLINQYLRIYHLEQGLYPGAHVENTDDLQNALKSPVPLWDADFGYRLQRPLQKVWHTQYSLRMQRQHRMGGLSHLRYGYQDNQRQEFDTRSYLPLPEMALALGTHTASYAHTKTIRSWRFENVAGLMFQQNVNQEANARQFIRNYQALNTWVYAMVSHHHRVLGRHEWALRYDQMGFTSYYRAPGTTLEDPAFRDARRFQRWSAAWTWNVTIPRTLWNMRMNAGTGWRPPSANELYANGLHQGMAALERGNPSLGPEHSQFLSVGVEWKSTHTEFQSEAGLRSIRDFIFLEPTQPPAITINGVYPQFAFVGRDALMRHWNSSLTQALGAGWKLNLTAALVRGRDVEMERWLVWMPADRWSLGLHRGAQTSGKDTQASRWWNKVFGGVELRHVSRQNRVPVNSGNSQSLDYAPSPDAYSLLRFYTGGSFMGQHFRWMLSVDNALNTRYRDYMNRLRYFADEPGRNIILRLQYHLHRHTTSS